MEYGSQEAAALLEVAPETLRDWSEQFASFLNDTAQQGRTTSEAAVRESYTEAEITLLRQVKALLSAGHSYDQVRLALISEQPLKKPRRPARRPIRRNGATQALTPSEDTEDELAVLPATYEQVIAAKDQQIAELEHMLKAEQRQVEQLAQDIKQLQADNQALAERLEGVATAYTPSYSFQVKILVTMAVVAALITIVIELLFNPNLW